VSRSYSDCNNITLAALFPPGPPLLPGTPLCRVVPFNNLGLLASGNVGFDFLSGHWIESSATLAGLGVNLPPFRFDPLSSGFLPPPNPTFPQRGCGDCQGPQPVQLVVPPPLPSVILPCDSSLSDAGSANRPIASQCRLLFPRKVPFEVLVTFSSLALLPAPPTASQSPPVEFFGIQNPRPLKSVFSVRSIEKTL